MLEVVLVVIGSLLQLVGLAGCFLPWLAGPPFNFIGLIFLCLAKGWDTFSLAFLILMAVLTLLTMILDYALPITGARKYGASKRGFWGAFIGMVLGVLFFPPLGMIIGAFIGAVVGELSAGKKNVEAMRAGWGVFLGVFVSLVFKVVVSGIMTFFFVRALV